MEQHKYIIKGTVLGSRCYEEYTENVSPEELVEYMEDIKMLFTKDSENELAQYIREDTKIHGIITEIWVDVKDIAGTLYSWTEVTANRELTKEEKEDLLNYLTGQFSDGYGEGLEQSEFLNYTETEEGEEWDEEEQEFYTTEYNTSVYMYLHLWNFENFHLEFVDTKDSEVEKNKSMKKEKKKPICRLIGEDGNIFHLAGCAARALRDAGLSEQSKEMIHKITTSKSYSEALSVIAEYVEVR